MAWGVVTSRREGKRESVEGQVRCGPRLCAGPGSGVQGAGWGSGLRVEGSGPRVQDSVLRLQGASATGRVTTRAEDAQETPTQSHISPSVLVYEDTLSAYIRQSRPDSGIGFPVKVHETL